MALSKFQQAFKDARASGKKEFEFNGKKYNTKYKEEASAPAKKADTKVKDEPSKVSAAVNQESSEASAEGKPFRPKNLTDWIGLSSNIRRPAAESKLDEKIKAAPENKNFSSSDKSSLSDISLRASRQAEANRAAMEANKPPPVPRKKSMLEEAREEATRRASAAQNYKDSKNVSTTPVRRFDGKGPGLGALSEMKAGGKVKMASGGSASKRADGIAQKGKTRGKMC
jgi:hypothetical protein